MLLNRSILFAFVLLIVLISAEKRIVCYYANWSVYRQISTPTLHPDAINPTLCTHIHIAFALINPQTLEIEPSEKHDTRYTDLLNTPLYLRFYNLKQKNPALKLLVAVGGWTAGSEPFNQILTNATTRMIFIQQTKNFLYKWHFDGIDLDWEFPGDIKRGAMNNSREQFNILIKEMSQSFQDDNHDFLLTAAVTANPIKVDQGYIVPDFCHYMDYVSIMSYDYYGAWDNVTGINAPLYRRDLSDEENKDEQWKNVNYSMHYWLNKGCPVEKLNLGLAAYGRSFTLANDSNSVSIGTDSIGGGLAGPHTKENGSLAYFEICQKLRNHNWTSVFDDNAQAPYAYSPRSDTSDHQWVGYDDLRSITVKILYAKSLNLSGIMIWTLDQDDHTGLFCRQGPFPLTQKIHELFLSSDYSNQGETSISTKSHGKSTISHASSQRRTSGNRKSTFTSTQSSSKSKNVGMNTKNHGTFYLLVIVIFCLL